MAQGQLRLRWHARAIMCVCVHERGEGDGVVGGGVGEEG